MADHGAYLVPTLVTYYKIEQLGRGLNFPEVSLRKVKDVLEAGLGALAIAKAAGVKIGFGTDYSARRTSFKTKSSRFARVRCRRRDHRSADDVNAEILGTGEVGTVAAGAMADLLVVDRDPLADIEVLADPEQHLDVIMKSGRFVVNRLG
jgi:imidazolonepropionase-like amidohydrolase